MQPALHRRAHCFEVGLQAVIARYEHDLALRPRWRDAERIALPLDDEGRYRDRIELGEAALRRPPRGLKREGEAENTDGAGRGSSTAGDPSAERATADYERELPDLTRTEVLDDRDEGSVELPSGRRGAPPRYPVRLLDERDPDTLRDRSIVSRDEIGRLDSAGRAVPEHERRARSLYRVDVHPRETVRGVELGD